MTEPMPYTNRDWLYREYVENQRSVVSIANEFGKVPPTVWYWMTRHEIPVRTQLQAAKVREARRKPAVHRGNLG